MKKFIILLLALLFIIGAAGCSGYSIPETISMSAPAPGHQPEVEILDAYCLDSQSSSFPFRFTLRNLENENIEVSYYWSLNDPEADGPGFQKNINEPLARQYQGQGKASLPASGTKEVEIRIIETREYDPRFYRMYVSVYQDNTQVGYYRQQKSTYDWDYSSTPPKPLPSPVVQAEEAPDDIVYPPGGPAYRANVHQIGVPDRWPSIQSKDVILNGPSGIAQVSYRDYIETKAGQIRNNIFSVYMPDAQPIDGTKAIKLGLEAINAPDGISVTHGDNVHLADPARRTKTVLKIEIEPQVKPGEYTLNIGVKLDEDDYGSVTCTIRLTE